MSINRKLLEEILGALKSLRQDCEGRFRSELEEEIREITALLEKEEE